MLWTPAKAGFSESQTGGFSDALVGTMIVAVMGIALALPMGVGIAVWLTEYGRPAGLARITESTIEAIAGIPSIVLALFGTVIFGSTALGFLSRTSDGVVFGRSFFAASAMLSLVALPLIVASTREGLNAIPAHVREASYAVGKTKAATTRRILLPTSKPQIATGAMLGLGRIIGDTAIIVVLLGRHTELRAGRRPLPGQLPARGRNDPDQFRLRGLPDREPQPAEQGLRRSLRAAADGPGAERGGRRRPSPGEKEGHMEFVTPPPVRRLQVDDEVPARQASPPASSNGHGPVPDPAGASFAKHRRIGPPQVSIDRMQVEQLSVFYDRNEAVKSVSLPVRQGEVLALIGPSGCGKTTLLRSLNRLTELTRAASVRGRITLDGVDIAAIEPTSLRRRVTMVFQQPNPFPMSIFDNIAYVIREQGSRRIRKKVLEPDVHGALDRAGLFEEVKDNLDHPALKLSGGQQQRLCIARALAANPEVLLLDEPCSALDPQSTEVIENLITRLRDDVAVVIVTHNLQQAYRVADHVGFMYLGDLVEYAPATVLFDTPREQRTREYVSGAFG